MDGVQDSNSSQNSMDNPEYILPPALPLAVGQHQRRPISAASAPGFDTDEQQSALQHPSSDMPSTSQHTGPEVQQQLPGSAHSEEAAALNTASTIVDVFAERLGIDPQQLDQQQKVSLLGSNVAALGVYLNYLNHKENHR